MAPPLARLLSSFALNLPLRYDLARLTAFDCGVLDEAKLKDEKELARLSRDNVQLVIDAIYALPMEVRATCPLCCHLNHSCTRINSFVIARAFPLPSQSTTDGDTIPLPAPTTHLPRSQPVPKPKPLTRWQKFAAEKVPLVLPLI